MGSSSSTTKTKTEIPAEIRQRGTAITTGAMGSYFDPSGRYQPFSMGGLSGGTGQASGGVGGLPSANQSGTLGGGGGGGGGGSYGGFQPYYGAFGGGGGGGGGGSGSAGGGPHAGGTYGQGGASGGGVGVGGQSGGASPISYGAIGDARTADLNSWHGQAGQGINNAQGVYQPYFNQASQTAQATHQGSGASGPVRASTGATYNPDGSANFAEYNDATMQRFMSPFVNNVTNVGMAELARAHEMQQDNINSQAASAGAFGGGRHGIQAAETTRGFADMGQKFLADSLSSAFSNAQNQYNTERGALFQQTGLNNQSAAQNFNQGMDYSRFTQGQGNDWQSAALKGAQAATEHGNLITRQDQATRDAAYDSYKDARDYPLEVYERLAGINAMQPVNRTSTSTQSQGGGWLGPAMYAGGQIGAAMLSDERTKEHVETADAEGVLQAFSKIEPVTYDYKEEARAAFPSLTAPGRRTGFMAQDYERAFGTKTREVDGIKTIDIPEVLGRIVVAMGALEKRTNPLAPRRRKK